MATHIRTAKSAQPLDLWGAPDPPKPTPAPEPAPKSVLLSPKAQALVEELAGFGVAYHPTQGCPACECPLSWPMQTVPGKWLCCRCWPRTKLYGVARHERILTLFPSVRKL